ncbi:MAG: ShlB/FhaC/HecB family hemolysin secretion/activation protein [Phormidesmis sp. RL_2_1]|nr:ShlB/FhaC/HecB family hemolysin secretion/activation protein [Phormidesmis sp. RL_2_1]
MSSRHYLLYHPLLLGTISTLGLTPEAVAQLTLPSAIPAESLPTEVLPPSDVNSDFRPEVPLPETPLPETPLPQLPPVEELLGEPEDSPLPDDGTSSTDETFVVTGIRLEGSSVFSADDFADLFAQYINRPVSFNELLQLRSAITQRYVDAGFVTSGAFIPPQTLENGLVTIQVIEGEIEEIEIAGTRRLNPDYIRSRLGLAAQPPINTESLLAGLQRLQIDPLIETVSADLQAGVRPGTNILRVDVSESDSFDITVGLDNGRSPNIGSFRRQVEISEGNVFGIGDRGYLSYANTDGSNSVDASYSVPVSPYNTRLNFEAGLSESRVIDDTFDVLQISSDSHYYEVGITHPLIETPTQEFSLGLALSHKRNQTQLGIDNIGPFPLSPGADNNGETRVTAMRFSQNWTKRSQQQVLAARSQFNLGLNLLNATDNEGDVPDSQFFSWRGQGQWVRLLGKDSLFLLRGDVQLAADSLLSSEQFGLGGQQSVRGYRQDALLRDNGALLSAEARFPIVRFSEESTVQVTPFIDAGAAWNNSNTPPGNNVLVGAGIGLLWQQGDNFSARLDWGLPLVDIDNTGDSLQDNGIYLSVRYNLF